MGRGRAKAKQTKVARALKYNAPNTDFDSLRAELTGAERVVPVAPVAAEPADPYESYYEEDADEDD
ncbi:MAG: DUF3073 domain-containing protein [Actinomycetes bacterium]